MLDYYNYSKNSSKVKFKDLHDAVLKTKEENKSSSPILKIGLPLYQNINILICPPKNIKSIEKTKTKYDDINEQTDENSPDKLIKMKKNGPNFNPRIEEDTYSEIDEDYKSDVSF
jgi:hypothetical protein